MYGNKVEGTNRRAQLVVDILKRGHDAEIITDRCKFITIGRIDDQTRPIGNTCQMKKDRVLERAAVDATSEQRCYGRATNIPAVVKPGGQLSIREYTIIEGHGGGKIDVYNVYSTIKMYGAFPHSPGVVISTTVTPAPTQASCQGAANAAGTVTATIRSINITRGPDDIYVPDQV
jgi:hypothetical protein